MKILFLFESVLPQSYHSQTIAPGELRVIAAQKDVTQVIALGPKGKAFYEIIRIDGQQTNLEKKIKLVHFKSYIPYYFRWIELLYHAYKLIKKEGIDLIHAESPHISGITALVLKRIFKIAIVIEYRASYTEIAKYRLKFLPIKWKLVYFNHICQHVFAKADLVLANSQTYAKQLKKQYPKANVHFYNPGVSPPLGMSKIQKQKIIGFLGRLYPDKGALYMIQAVELIANQLRSRGWKVEIAGDGPQLKMLTDYITEHQLDNLIKLVGTKYRWDFFPKITILVNPNIINNALEMVNVEAGFCKVPVVCYGDKTTPETVINNLTGYKAINGNITDLANKIEILINNKILLNNLGINAYNFVTSKYSFKTQINNLASCYKLLS